MPKVMMNQMKWKADLQVVWEFLDRDDRPTIHREKKRDVFYCDIGITAQEKYLSQQAKTDVIRRIKVRWDKTITEKHNAIRIDGISYRITRIFTDRDKREMELSLAYVE